MKKIFLNIICLVINFIISIFISMLLADIWWILWMDGWLNHPSWAVLCECGGEIGYDFIFLGMWFVTFPITFLLLGLGCLFFTFKDFSTK